MWIEVKRGMRLASGRRTLLAEALLALALARVMMLVLPFRRIAAWMGTPGAESPPSATEEEIRTAKEIGWAVSALGRRVPWDGRCLAQALAATGMLRRRGLEGTICFGAGRVEGAEFNAHAWLRVGPYLVTGGAGHQRFKQLTSFARRRA